MTVITSPISKVLNLAKFIEDREKMRNALNYQIAAIRVRMEEESEANKEVVLFSIPLHETMVNLSEKACRHLFPGTEFPYNGVLLREIEIVHQEYIDDGSYRVDIAIRFLFDKQGFNSTRSHFPLHRLSFDDRMSGFIDSSMGGFIAPIFLEKEKYKFAKSTVSKIQKQLAKLRD